jgi:hypothetical protein
MDLGTVWSQVSVGVDCELTVPISGARVHRLRLLVIFFCKL